MAVAQELHQDGNKHLHCVVIFKDKQHFRDPSCFDFLGGKHGKYEVVRSLKETAKYLTKHDKNPAEYNIDLKQVCVGQARRSTAIIAQRLIAGETVRDVALDPEYSSTILHLGVQKVMAFAQLVSTSSKPRLPWDSFVCSAPFRLPPDPLHLIAKWIDEALYRDRHPKSPQLWIWSHASNMNKTRLSDELEKYGVRIFRPAQNGYWNGYQDGLYDLVYFDEFKGSYTIQDMNLFLGGSPCLLNAKAGQVDKRQNIPCLITANYPPEGVYLKNPERIQNLASRLLVVEVTKKIDLAHLLIKRGALSAPLDGSVPYSIFATGEPPAPAPPAEEEDLPVTQELPGSPPHFPFDDPVEYVNPDSEYV